ncbi:MAG: ABC transporter ATP-binding protein [Clostridia bacterium]|nr:ABC transporter ATP-binding protein [Clostridia bacterium]
MSLLSVKELSMQYDNTYALNDISFSIEEGDYLCIVGENGSGKSTLLKGILGLMPVSSGDVLFGDGLKPNQIGYLPQSNNMQRDFPASCYEVVLSGRLSRKGINPFYNKKDKEKANEVMNLLQISDLAKKSFKELSGGQQQRILLARALCATDKLLVVDEPTTGLDPMMTAEFYKLVNKLNKLYGITIIMTTHDTTTLSKYANKILHLQNSVAFFGSVSDYEKTDLAKMFLGGHHD